MKDKPRYKFLILFALITLTVILLSCGISNSNPTTVSFTEISTQTSLPMVTNTLTPIPTMEPTLAFWATAQESSFETQRVQQQETQQAIFALSNQYPKMCGYSLEGVSMSPDGKWVATDCMWDLLRVFQTDGNKIWDVPYSEIFQYYPEFLGSVKALHWSKDGKYLYFSNSSCCADTDATTNGDNLYKLDLKTGKWVLIVSGIFNYYSFSPDGERLIYILNNQASANETLDLHVLNIDSGKEEIINVGNFERGRVVWKKDGQKISVIVQVGNLIEENSKYSLVSIDLKNKQIQIIILNSQNGLGITDWSNDDVLTIRQTKAVEYNGHYINVREVVIYDLKTNKFITQ